MPMAVFCTMMPYGLIGGDQRFGGIYFCHLQGTSALKMEAVCASDTLPTYKPTRRHSVEDRHGQKKLFLRQFPLRFGNFKSMVAYMMKMSSLDGQSSLRLLSRLCKWDANHQGSQLTAV